MDKKSVPLFDDINAIIVFLYKEHIEISIIL